MSGNLESACIYYGNCLSVCKTGSLIFKSKFGLLRNHDRRDDSRQSVTRIIFLFCTIGCNLDLHVQDNRIVKVTSLLDYEVTGGMLGVKGSFVYEFSNR